MSNRKKLPLTLQNLPMPFEAHVYPSPKGGRGVTVKGQGHITLTFEETKDPQIAQVRIEDIEANLAPISIVFDLDGDGKLEHIDLDGLELDARAFDLERSGGDYNLKNGHIHLNFIFSISPDAFLHVGELPGSKAISPIHFEIAEQGWLDLETGHFLTHSAPFTVREGAFSGLTIMGTQPNNPVDVLVEEIPWVDLRVVVRTGVDPIPTGTNNRPKEVWICPFTPILLSWTSNSRDVRILPCLIQGIDVQRTNNGSQEIRSISGSTLYGADTMPLEPGFCHDQVLINVPDGHQTYVVEKAEYSDLFGYWVAKLWDYKYDQNLKVDKIMIQTKDYETMQNLPDTISYDKWRLEHVYLDDPVFMDVPVDTMGKVETRFAMPGEYRFRPVLEPGTQLPPKETANVLYFYLSGYCK